MKAGRKRKTNVLRDAKGKSRGEPEIVHPESIAVRERELSNAGLSLRGQDALNQLAGFTLGCLLLRARADRRDPGSISQEQYDAGDSWQNLCHRHASIMGYKSTVKSPSFIMVAGGQSVAAEPDEDEISRVREKWTKAYNALMLACRDHGIRVRDVTYGVCVENWPVSRLRNRDYGLLRIGLNALAKVLDEN